MGILGLFPIMGNAGFISSTEAPTPLTLHHQTSRACAASLAAARCSVRMGKASRTSIEFADVPEPKTLNPKP